MPEFLRVGIVIALLCLCVASSWALIIASSIVGLICFVGAWPLLGPEFLPAEIVLYCVVGAWLLLGPGLMSANHCL